MFDYELIKNYYNNLSQKLLDIKKACSDWKQASELGVERAYRLFKEECTPKGQKISTKSN